jgi:uncharacterized membrane protein YfbV (UPF0208 family)
METARRRGASPEPAGPRGERVVRARTPAQSVVLFIFAIMPLTFIQNQVFGFQMSGWSWLLVLMAVAPLVATSPFPRRAMPFLLPYLLFLAYACATLAWTQDVGEGVATLTQFIVPALAYLLAWRVSVRFEPDILPRLRRTCLSGLAIAAVLAVGLQVEGGPLLLSPRPMAISLVVIFVVATIQSTSWRYTLMVGVVALSIAIATGSRMSTLVLLAVLLCSPSLGLRWHGRAAIAVTCVVLAVLATQTPVFKERFFFDEDASLMDLLTVSNNVNTAGRRELWPKLLEECTPASATGLGIGTSTPLSFELSRGTLDLPHNDYIRSYCDEGWAGTILIWSFFLMAGLRSWARAIRGRAIDRQVRALHGAAGQLVLALAIFAITDNPLSYTAHFMAPIAAILALSDRALAERRGPALAGAPGARPDDGARQGSRRSATTGWVSR